MEWSGKKKVLKFQLLNQGGKIKISKSPIQAATIMVTTILGNGY